MGTPEISSENYETILDEEALNRWAQILREAGEFAFDTETDSLDNLSARLVGMSFAAKAGHAAYVPIGHDYLDAPDQLLTEQVLRVMKPILEDEKIRKIGQNLKFDRGIMENYGVELRGIAFDTMLELSRMERTGVLIDANVLAAQSAELTARLDELEKQAFAIAGEEFNLSSPKQLQTILFEKLNLPVVKKTPGGAPSTNEEVLEELADNHELPRVILEHRSLSKLKTTYTDKLPLMVDPKTRRVHTSYHQAVTATGRLSSRDPNLQNIPVRTDEGRRIRQAFIARDGYCIMAADYSQIELRIMAHLSQDKGLLKAFAEGKDIHRATAAEVFGVPLDEVTADQRRSAKAINFGLIYGMSAFGLARQLGIPRGEAQRYMDLYFERYPGVLEYMARTREHAAEKGYVETLEGRRLWLPEINSRNGMRRKAAEREAINAPMQGTAADIIKKAMIAVDDWLQKENIDALMIMQVHDELVFEVRKEQQAEMAEKIRGLMEAAMKLDVPLKVDAGVGANWDEAH